MAEIRHQIAFDLLRVLQLRDAGWPPNCAFGARVKLFITIVLVCSALPDLLTAAEDPFAGYHASVDERLSALAETARMAVTKTDAAQQVTPSKAVPLAAPVPVPLNGEPPAAITRLQKFRDQLERILDQEGVPRALVAVVVVESGAEPLAMSPKQARGLWQLMPGTARDYGLVVTGTRDQRVEIEGATRAAARYLRDLYSKFGDWQLALAAYNAGPDAIDRAIQRGRTSSFARLAQARLLPAETANYVPAVLSAMTRLAPPTSFDAAAVPQPHTTTIIYAPSSISN